MVCNSLKQAKDKDIQLKSQGGSWKHNDICHTYTQITFKIYFVTTSNKENFDSSNLAKISDQVYEGNGKLI